LLRASVSLWLFLLRASASSVSPLEADPHPDLARARNAPGAQRREHEERGQAAIARRVVEVGSVGEVEDLPEHVERSTLAERDAVTEPRVELEELRPVRPVAPALALHGDGIRARAAVLACRQRVGQDAIPVGVGVAVTDGERRPTERPGHEAHGESFRLRHEDRTAEDKVVTPVEIGRPLVLIQLHVVEQLEEGLRDTVAAGVAAGVRQRVRRSEAVVVRETLLELHHERVVVGGAQVEPLQHLRGEVGVGAHDRRRPRRRRPQPCVQVLRHELVPAESMNVVGAHRDDASKLLLEANRHLMREGQPAVGTVEEHVAGVLHARTGRVELSEQGDEIKLLHEYIQH